MAIGIIAACSTLAFLHYTGKANNMPPYIDANAVRYSWYFAVVAHGVEAIYVAYLSHTKLKLSVGITMKWFLLVCCTGFPFTTRFMPLVNGEKEEKDA